MELNRRDIEFLKQRNISPSSAYDQVARLTRGTRFIRLRAPARPGRGIEDLTTGQEDELARLYDRRSADRRVIKFVPASGAASRMFRFLTRYFQGEEPADGKGGDSWQREKIARFFTALKAGRFAFAPVLREALTRSGQDLDELIGRGDHRAILKILLTGEGMNYANLPKGLIPFHRYPDQRIVTAFAEHIRESAAFGVHRPGLHFTIPRGFQDRFDREARGWREEPRAEVTYSFQKADTDTLALDEEGNLYRDSDGLPLLRPGGHGALIENLNDISADIVLIRNIDNVPRKEYHPGQVRTHKVLAGLLISRQEETQAYLQRMAEEPVDPGILPELTEFARSGLNITLTEEEKKTTPEKLIRILRDRLNRPLRVCGVVPNEGQPGGGPFWVEDVDGRFSLQIVEKAQVDLDSPGQIRIWEQATHFNPVNIACGVRDHTGRAFQLSEFVDSEAYFVTRKSRRGKPLLALELPGLWNGAMARWNTIMVEVPRETFNPVKEVNDLLQPAHSPRDP